MDRRVEIEAILAKDVLPLIRSHGGDMEIRAVEGDTVTVLLTGVCSGCPAADLSTKAMIEEALRGSSAQIEHVILEDDTSESLLDLARKILRKETD
ncbi:MAG: NifU family protein [Firmicutes bacterium]|nr:NifU family protein [Bacillota bacterium]